MPNIHLTLAGPPEAAYPNGGDEAYWMGQVAGALAAGLNSRGIALCWGRPRRRGPSGWPCAPRRRRRNGRDS